MQTSSTQHIECAPAKINLFLHISGRRADDFHQLESLVCFAIDVGDRLTVRLGEQTRSPPDISTSGPFAAKISGRNLVSTAVERLVELSPGLIAMQSLDIQKNLPVAAGVGGGSADAAALLRSVQSLQPELVDIIDWLALAASLGADVPVCLLSRSSWMTGTGEIVTPLSEFPVLAAVLVNPQVPVPDNKTAQVFKTLDAPDFLEVATLQTVPDVELDFTSADTLIAGLATLRNDLEAPACAVMPRARDVLLALGRSEGCRLARLSGAGPTGFGLFATIEAARLAAEQLQSAHPDWWVTASRLG